jgi:hypothetical protein
MKKQVELIIPPEKIYDNSYFKKVIATKLGVNSDEILSARVIRRSIDARKAPIYRLLVEAFIGEQYKEDEFKYNYNPVDGKHKVIVVGFGPAGMFASLRLIELGIKPIIFERGKDVQARRRDLKAIQQNHIINPDSNYCFGEGGAGTYSDGKLYTRAAKRGNVRKILELFVKHGAKQDVLIDTHPHIGSNELPKIVASIRNTILKCGGEIHYNSKVTDLIMSDNKVSGVVINDNDEHTAGAVILAVGHSARDIFYLLHRKGFKLEQKAFAMGVRIEHPQSLINEIQYHIALKPENLPPAVYSISCDVDGRGIYSFCMCPGGLIVPAATNPGELVVNGMSMAKRDSYFANSGIVVEVNESDWKVYQNDYPFAGLKLQKELEQNAFRLANNTLSAPAQRATDFISGKFSQTLPKSSYIPGLTSARLDQEFPSFITSRLKRSLLEFDRKMKGYLSDEAVLVAPETRTSSPVRVLRNRETFMHMENEGLFPCGEGAGYAGGIVSSALDGENCANAVNQYLS